jgi:hypothetical protein
MIQTNFGRPLNQYKMRTTEEPISKSSRPQRNADKNESQSGEKARKQESRKGSKTKGRHRISSAIKATPCLRPSSRDNDNDVGATQSQSCPCPESESDSATKISKTNRFVWNPIRTEPPIPMPAPPQIIADPSEPP